MRRLTKERWKFTLTSGWYGRTRPENESHPIFQTLQVIRSFIRSSARPAIGSPEHVPWATNSEDLSWCHPTPTGAVFFRPTEDSKAPNLRCSATRVVQRSSSNFHGPKLVKTRNLGYPKIATCLFGSAWEIQERNFGKRGERPTFFFSMFFWTALSMIERTHQRPWMSRLEIKIVNGLCPTRFWFSCFSQCKWSSRLTCQACTVANCALNATV